MSDTAAGLLQIGLLVALLAAVYRPLGGYMARVYTSEKDSRVERGTYRLLGVDSKADQTWAVYARSIIAFSAISMILLYLIQRLQSHLPLSLGLPNVEQGLAFNTAASFVANTNWQSYSPEVTMGHLVQFAGLAVQNFLSAAVGITVAVALIRGFSRSRTERLGNFWVDLTRTVIRVLLPIAVLGGLVLVAMGVVQNLSGGHEVASVVGQSQTLPGGPVASQEIIKELGNNGGGFYNANSGHPFENPNGLSNLFEIFLMLVIPVALTRTFGLMVKDKRQGYAILGVMATLWTAFTFAATIFEVNGAGTATRAAGAAMEGKETRFGEWASTLFTSTTTGTSTGAVNAAHDSYTPLGGGTALFHMMLGEVTPGGVGAGLYGMLVLAVLAVFVAGLMVGRTPEYLRKKITAREMKLVSLYILTTPSLILIGSAVAMGLETARASIFNTGSPHGFSEVLYAFTSAGNNNGSAFGGLSANVPFYNTALGLVMLLSRFLPIVLVLALAGSFARQQPVPVNEGTLPTHKALFVTMLVGVVVIVTGLTYFPALTLGPLAEGL
ncbi:K+-transporting ATPase ATPase A chain [Kribbella orskensis]|uniref:Potassium-transporting ATPase potassium-binding subunit n=1 Tax=Kribbella orskensis TaxID=2512216 RepID=A0ABY2BR85_9ACTN|nr:MULTISPECIES: potassium-transporting ATPase subunit KdpA [Kribbella]TCN29315.1 K+-transporting ATPase ATPase A chain [Kribbella sp. VKM Ac-2500]TCO28005.1 K+-transporting ATPase ATPase A chain [Kribbella orskensis]